MCFSVYKQSNILKLCLAAQNVQKLIDDGTLPEAFDKNRHGEAHKAVVAFDLLAKAAAVVVDERKEVSPFLRYRKEIMGGGDTATSLQSVVLNLWGGRHCNLSTLFMNADPHHTRIALECIASYTHHGENDLHFMNLASEIVDYSTEMAI